MSVWGIAVWQSQLHEIVDLAGIIRQAVVRPSYWACIGCTPPARSIRDELSRLGHRFKTRSDIEVVLRGYLQWGEKVAEHLNGMFAFAIWEVVTQELFLVRDRMGVKPLFYYPTADAFGSEPKATSCWPRARPLDQLLGEGITVSRWTCNQPDRKADKPRRQSTAAGVKPAGSRGNGHE
jgi:asparagine synthetase B (glutamine-hydrolysing)